MSGPTEQEAPGFSFYQILYTGYGLYCHRTNRSMKFLGRGKVTEVPAQVSPSHAKEAIYSYCLWPFRCVSINRTFQKTFLAIFSLSVS